jgi:hypothetical protein
MGIVSSVKGFFTKPVVKPVTQPNNSFVGPPAPIINNSGTVVGYDTGSQSVAIGNSGGGSSGGGSSGGSRIITNEQGVSGIDTGSKSVVLTPTQSSLLSGGGVKVYTPKVEKEIPKTAVYDNRFGGVITSDGKIYTTNNTNWLPSGYVQGYGTSYKDGVGVSGIPETVNRSVQSYKPVSEVTSFEKRNVLGNVQQFFSNQFKNKFGVTPREVGQNIKETYSPTGRNMREAAAIPNTFFSLPSKELTYDQAKKYTEGSFTSRVSAIYNPKNLYEVGISNINREDTIQELNNLNKQYEAGKISESTYTKKYNSLSGSLGKTYNAENIITSGEGLTKWQRGYGGLAIGAGRILPLVNPFTAAASGLSALPGDSLQFRNAAGSDKIKAGINLGFDALMIGSAAKGLIPKTVVARSLTTVPEVKFFGSVVKGTPELNWYKGAVRAGSISIGTSLAAVPAAYQYSQTGNKEAALGTFASMLVTPYVASKGFSQITSRVPKKEFWGMSEREFNRKQSLQTSTKLKLSQESIQSEYSLNRLLKTESKLDKSVATLNEKYGLDIKVPSASSSSVRYGNSNFNIGKGELTQGGKKARAVYDIGKNMMGSLSGDVKQSSKEFSMSSQRINIKQRPDIVLKVGSLGDVTKKVPGVSNKFKSLFPELTKEYKFNQYQGTITSQGKNGFTSLAYSVSEDLQSGKMKVGKDLALVRGDKQIAIADIIAPTKSKIGGAKAFGKVKETQIFKIDKSESKPFEINGVRGEIRKTDILSGITSNKGTLLSEGDFTNKLNTGFDKSEIKDLGKFYQTKTTNVEKVLYNKKPKIDLAISGDLPLTKLKGELKLSVVDEYRLKGSSKTTYLNPKEIAIENLGRLETAPTVKGLVINKEKKTLSLEQPEQILKLEAPTIKQNVIIKTDTSKLINVPKQQSIQSPYYGKGLYETTNFGLLGAGKLSSGLKVNLNGRLETLSIPKTKSIDVVSEVNIIKESNILSPSSGLNIREDNKIGSLDKLSPVQRNNQSPQQKIVTRESLQPKLVNRIKFIDRISPRQSPKPVLKPKIDFSFKSPGGENPKRKMISKKNSNKKSFGSFDLVTRVRGKEKTIATRLTRTAALDLGTAVTLFGNKKASSLSASIILKPSKEKVLNVQTKGEFARFGNIFRQGKTKSKGASEVFVQKDFMRLGTSNERRQIVESRGGFRI